MIDPTHAPFSCERSTTTVNSLSGNLRSALPPAADYIFSSTRQRRSGDQDHHQPHERAGRCHELSGSQLPGCAGAFTPLKLR